MKFSRVIHPKASEDIKEIALHYKEIKPNLAKDFTGKIRSNVNKLLSNPRACQVRYHDVVRVSHIKKFPYSIHFIIDESRMRIVILAVFAMKENPEKWNKRFKEVKSEL